MWLQTCSSKFVRLSHCQQSFAFNNSMAGAVQGEAAASASSSACSSGAAVAAVHSLLGQRFRVTLKDSRVFVGDFQCLDKQGNLVLGRAAELMGPGGEQERPVGMVLVPGPQRKTVEVQANLAEHLSTLKLEQAAG